MVDFFNSSVGILNKARADLDVIILLLEKNIPVNMEQLITAIDNIKFNSSYNTIIELTNDFLKLEKIKSKNMLKIGTIKLRNKIYEIVNDYSKTFYKKL